MPVRPDQNVSTSLPSALDDGDDARDRKLLGHRCRPRAAAVVGALHRELVGAVADQRVREVAAPPERARRAVVAREPVLVVGELLRRCDRRIRRARSTSARWSSGGSSAGSRPAPAPACSRARRRGPRRRQPRDRWHGRTAPPASRPWSGRAGSPGARCGRRPSTSRSRCPRPRLPGAVRPGRAATVVAPTVDESGSTSDSCWLSAFVNWSRWIRRPTISQSVPTRSRRSAVTMSRPGPQETSSGPASYSTAILSFPPRASTRSGPSLPSSTSARGVPTRAGRAAAVATAGSVTSKRTIATRPRTMRTVAARVRSGE